MSEVQTLKVRLGTRDNVTPEQREEFVKVLTMALHRATTQVSSDEIGVFAEVEPLPR